MNHEEFEALIRAQFIEGPLDPKQQVRLRDHLRTCEACKQVYDRYTSIEQGLEDRTTSSAQLERLKALGAPVPQRKRPWLPLVALAAGVLIVSVVIGRPPSEPTGFQARSGDGTVTPTVEIYRWVDARPKPLGETLERGDGMLFAYSNPQGSKYRYLLIAGLDAAGKAHWYHPAYEHPEQQPMSIPIRAGADIELKERVHNKHAPGPLKICAIFSEGPLAVREVDRALEERGAWPQGHLDCVSVKVRP